MSALKVRSGSAFRTTIRYRDPEGVEIDTTGYTAQFQIRATQPHGKVLFETTEYTGVNPAPVGTNLVLTGAGTWDLFLGKSLTNILPPSSRWEFEIISDTFADDSQTLATGSLLVEPQGVQ